MLLIHKFSFSLRLVHTVVSVALLGRTNINMWTPLATIPIFEISIWRHQNNEKCLTAKLLLPQRSLGKVMFLYVSLILFTGGPPWDQAPSPGADPPGSSHPLGPGIPPGPGTPQDQCMLGDTGNKQVVRILLECILVHHIFVVPETCQFFHLLVLIFMTNF